MIEQYRINDAQVLHQFCGDFMAGTFWSLPSGKVKCEVSARRRAADRGVRGRRLRGDAARLPAASQTGHRASAHSAATNCNSSLHITKVKFKNTVNLIHLPYKYEYVVVLQNVLKNEMKRWILIPLIMKGKSILSFTKQRKTKGFWRFLR